MKITLEAITKLRTETKAGIMDCKRALAESKGDFSKAKEILKQKGLATAVKKADRATGAGIIESYVHCGANVGVLVKLSCETDFVARNEEFRKLAHEICLQIASMNPKNVEILLEQEYIRDGQKKIKDLVTETIAKVGENIKIEDYCRLEI
jgi:elongation factor Ts